MTMVPGFLPLFCGNDYVHWSIRMKTILKAVDLWDVVESGIEQEPPYETDESEWDVVESGIEKEALQKTHDESKEESYAAAAAAKSYKAYQKKCMEMKDAAALQMIHNAVSYAYFSWISSATSAKEAWEHLMVRSLGGPMLRSRILLDLKNEYEVMKMSDSETINVYTWKVMDLVFRMRSYGWKVEDKEVVKKILSSLSPRFTNVLVEVSETLSITALIDCLMVHEYNMGPVGVSLDESVVNQSVDVEQIIRQEEEAESFCTKTQVALMEKQMEVLSLAQQNQMTLVQLQNQMKVLMQPQQKPQQQEQVFGKYDMADYSKISWSF